MIELDGDLYATRAEAAAALQDAGQAVTAEMIRAWTRRGLLSPLQRPSGEVVELNRQPVYRMKDVWAVELSTRRSARSHRRSA